MINDWIDRIEARAREMGISLEEVARHANLDRSYFRKAKERGGSQARGDTLTRVAKVLKVDPAFILTGNHSSTTFERIVSRSPVPDSVIPVPEIDVRAGAGGGGQVREAFETGDHGWEAREGIKEHWGIPAGFLRHEARTQPHDAHILEITGDSMLDPANPTAIGTLLPGDRAIINMRDKTPSPPGAFAVWDGYGVVIKMIEIVAGSKPPRIRLSSRNPGYTPYEVAYEEARILGRVRGRITVF